MKVLPAPETRPVLAAGAVVCGVVADGSVEGVDGGVVVSAAGIEVVTVTAAGASLVGAAEVQAAAIRPSATTATTRYVILLCTRRWYPSVGVTRVSSSGERITATLRVYRAEP